MKLGQRILLFICILTTALGLVAQEPANQASIVVESNGKTAPILWEYYQLPDEKLSVMLPKLPVESRIGDPCEQTRGSAFHVYADNAVYELRFYAKLPVSASSSNCWKKVSFSENTLTKQVEFLRQTKPAPVLESNTNIGLRRAQLFTWNTPTEIAKRWIIADFANDRWVELSVNYRKNSAVDESRFLNSLQLGSPIGKVIGPGSLATLGDTESQPAKQRKLESLPVDGPLLLINKSPAAYTDAARSSAIHGTVKLKVTFLANGCIGNITVVSSLPNGLTEEAIAAARRFVFIPKRANGVAVSLVKEVHYGFSIY